MPSRTKKIVSRCQVTMTKFNGRITMKCKNLKRKPTKKEAKNYAQNLIDSLKNNKIICK